ncbi:helix-turn-helix transcriptional regulator [Actinocorallia longicatena]|uniref:Helix-turn-helix transcriptional regulator n=1 Tax=Actinocorallia longicatena TaxID=111803 RepID=A0ABP6Q0S1_9ACTN
MYREREVPGGTLWTRRADTAEVARVIPDGCLDLLWIRDELVVAGPDTGPHLAATGAGEVITGLRFASGRGPAVLGVPARELRDARVPLADLWAPGAVRELTERLAAARVPGRVLAEAVAGLRAEPDPIVPGVLASLAEGVPVADCARRTGLSERQLHRRSLDAFGYGLRTLSRVHRLGRALELVRSGRPLAETAAVAGYADQPHLTREVRALTGVAPTAFAPVSPAG